MKKLFFFLAAIAVAFTANAKVIQGTPNPGESGRVNWWANGAGQAEAGDTIVLADGIYEESTLTLNDEGLVIMAAEGAKPVIVLTDAGGWGSVKIMASVTFDGICFDGNSVTKYMVQVAETNVKKAVFNNCEFKDYAKHAICDPWTDSSDNGKHIDSVLVNNCLFQNGGPAVCFSKYGPEGKHVCNYLEVKNSTINKVSTTIDPSDTYYGIIHASSNGEATGVQNEVVIDHITVYDYTMGSLGAITIRKSSNLKISNSIIANPAGRDFFAFYIYGGTIDNTLYYNGKDDTDATHTACLNVDPKFVDAANGNFALAEGSPALGAGTDGSNLGDPRWNAPAVEEPEIDWIKMPLEITNLATMEMPVEGVTYLQLTGRDDMNDANVMLFLNNYTGEEKAYEVNVESSSMTFGGSELKVIDGSITKSVDPELGDVYAGTVHASMDEDGQTMYVEFALKMYALPAIEIEIEDVEITVNEESAIATFAATWEGSPLSVEVSGFEEVEVKEYPECWLTIGDDVNWVDAAAGPVAVIIEDGVASLEGEFVSNATGKSYNVTLTGKLPAKPQDPTALDNVNTTVAPVKAIVNGQLVILKEGVKYNAQGAQL